MAFRFIKELGGGSRSSPENQIILSQEQKVLSQFWLGDIAILPKAHLV